MKRYAVMIVLVRVDADLKECVVATRTEPIVLVRVDADLEECVVATKTEPIGKFEAVIVLARCASSE
eukprot:CAMPEP_0169173036 /NCGR_PEP_ID=MMETSP1015-20121227/63705_1 /TAXON_ID=342587 /ORGANISM="Karlodinium micrum, Strain CCMP2283" /LENGTH=66 /DNA_ID=CAMNT_0009246615 /DNA_START=165 /DNA_END=365 /DNA_ORIENTATION=-